MPTREIEFTVPEFNQWPLNCEPPSKFSVVCASMEKAWSGSSQGAGLRMYALPNQKLPFSDHL